MTRESSIGVAPEAVVYKSLKWWPALAGFLLIFLLSGVFLPYPGLQNDEVLFAQPLYLPGSAAYAPRVGGTRMPVMILNYLGAWKTWFYAPILKHWAPSVFSIRWPVVAICALTACIFFHLLKSLHGWRAGAIGTLLLATDSSFLLTGAFDWGPVAFQHLFLVAALALAVYFHKTGSLRALGLAAFCAGLGLWDKALFLWPLSGVCAASLALVPSAWRPSRRKLFAATLGFGIGALPFLVFNVSHRFATFRSNSGFTLTGLPQKFEVLKRTWNGSALFGFLIHEEDSTGSPHEPDTRMERWSRALHDAAGTHRTNWMMPVLLAALILLPVLWRTRARPPMLFALIACAIAWLEMATTPNAGGAAHHAVLLWPLPQIFIAVAIAEATLLLKKPGTWLAVVLTLLLMAGNLLNLNQCFYQLARYGAAGDWTDATDKLTSEVSKIPSSTPLLAADWGVFSTLTVLRQGTLNLKNATAPFAPQAPNTAQERAASDLFAEKGAVWIRFVAGREQFPGINQRLDKMAAAAGYRESTVAQFGDRNGRPEFELFRLER